jgi:hypothetical protein
MVQDRVKNLAATLKLPEGVQIRIIVKAKQNNVR